jgi:hypothetical protein
MIRIRSQQLEAFATKRADAFVDELVVEASHASAGGDVRPIVLAGIEAAIGRGFRTPDGIRGFVRRIFVLGIAYYQHAAVRDWIGELGLSEQERLAVVDAHADEIRATNT